MLALSHRQQLAVGALLALLITITRSHHFAGLHNLPGASWAMFFLAGVYLRPLWALAGLMALTWGLDFAYYFWGNGSNFCFSPAYPFLVPAYASLWLAGRWYARRHSPAWRTLLPLALATLAGAAACQLFSSGGFYLFSGYFQPSLAEFLGREARYFPPALQAMAFWLALAAIAHAGLAVAPNLLRQLAAR